MKKHSLLKTIGIAFLVAVVLSWIIPTGSFSSSTFTSGETSPVGIINLFRLPVMTIQTFIQYFIVLLAIGGFYGVINKTGVYSNIVKNIAKKWKGKEKVALIVITIVFALVASLTGLSMLLFAIVPFIAAILLTLGYDKITVLLSTIGSILVGEAGSIIGFSGAGYIKNMFSIEMTDEIVTKIILFVILTGLYVFFVVKKSKLTKTSKSAKKDSNEVVIPFLGTETKKDAKKLPLVVAVIALVTLCLVGMYNWYYAFGISVFNELHTSLQDITIGDYPIVANLLAGVTSLGYWGNYELAIALVIGSLIIGWIYNIGFEGIVDSFKDGAKEMLPVAFYATICNVIFTIMLASDTNMYATIINWLSGFAESFNLIIVYLITLIGSFFYNDFYYLLSGAAPVLSGYDAVYYPIIGVVTTAIHSIVMMIIPTSVMLIIGLKYFDVSFKDWIKNIWLYIVEALVIVIIVSVIVVVLI